MKAKKVAMKSEERQIIIIIIIMAVGRFARQLCSGERKLVPRYFRTFFSPLIVACAKYPRARNWRRFKDEMVAGRMPSIRSSIFSSPLFPSPGDYRMDSIFNNKRPTVKLADAQQIPFQLGIYANKHVVHGRHAFFSFSVAMLGSECSLFPKRFDFKPSLDAIKTIEPAC